MPQRQYVITEWLLKLFGRDEPAGRTLSVFDKSTGSMGRDVPSRFSTILDDHSGSIESDLERIERDAAEHMRRLPRRLEFVEPGLWPLCGRIDNLAGIRTRSAHGLEGLGGRVQRGLRLHPLLAPYAGQIRPPGT